MSECVFKQSVIWSLGSHVSYVNFDLFEVARAVLAVF